MKDFIKLAIIALVLAIPETAFFQQEIHPCTQFKIVKQVGGCDFFGRCGVEYADLTNGREPNPTRGQVVCTAHAWFFNK